MSLLLPWHAEAAELCPLPLPLSEQQTRSLKGPHAQAVTCINNVVIGRINLEHKGAYSVRCLGAGGLTAALKLHATTMLTTQARKHEARPCPCTWQALQSALVPCALPWPSRARAPTAACMQVKAGARHAR